MNLKHLVILILLILIVFLVVNIHSMNKREQFQYNHNQRDSKVKRCSEAIAQLVNIVESLKAVNLL